MRKVCARIDVELEGLWKSVITSLTPRCSKVIQSVQVLKDICRLFPIQCARHSSFDERKGAVDMAQHTSLNRFLKTFMLATRQSMLFACPSPDRMKSQRFRKLGPHPSSTDKTAFTSPPLHRPPELCCVVLLTPPLTLTSVGRPYHTNGIIRPY